MRLKKTLILLGAVSLFCAAPLFSTAQQKSARKTPAAKKASSKRSKSRRGRGQKAPAPERIKEIQTALAREGAYNGQPNGKWDAGSVEAMKRFQAAHHLPTTGKLDARTLQVLGLGSEVAGRAAPLPLATQLPPTSSRPR